MEFLAGSHLLPSWVCPSQGVGSSALRAFIILPFIQELLAGVQLWAKEI